MKILIPTILSSLFNYTYANLLSEQSNCITECNNDYYHVNVTKYANCLENCCVRQGRSFIMVVVVLAMIIIGLGYCLYTHRNIKHNHSQNNYYNSMV